MTQHKSIVFPGAARSMVLQSDPAWAEFLVIEQHQSPPGESFGLYPSTHVLMLHLGTPGRIEVRMGTKTEWATVAPNSLSLYSEGTRLEWRMWSESQVLAAALDPMFIAAVANQTGRASVAFRNLAGFHDAAITHILLALRAGLNRKCAAGRLYWEALATALAAHLLRSYVARPVKTAPCRGGLAPARLRRVLDYIETHLQDDLCLRELADIAMLSPSHFATAFRESTGLPPYRYVMQRRAIRAKDLLADPRHPLADIAYALGYSSQAHFTTMFRKLTGKSPGAYRSTAAPGAAVETEAVFARSLNDHRQAKDPATGDL